MEVTVGGITGARTISLRRSASVWYTTGVRGRSAGEPGNDPSDAVVYTRRLLPPMTDRDVERRIEMCETEEASEEASQVKSSQIAYLRPHSLRSNMFHTKGVSMSSV